MYCRRDVAAWVCRDTRVSCHLRTSEIVMRAILSGIGMTAVLFSIAGAHLVESAIADPNMLGGADCNVTETGTHLCGVGFLGSVAGATACTPVNMDTTWAGFADYATMREVASDDNCNNYRDNLGHLCENVENEPVTPNCPQKSLGFLTSSGTSDRSVVNSRHVNLERKRSLTATLTLGSK